MIDGLSVLKLKVWCVFLSSLNSCFVKPGPALYYGVLLIVALLLAANFTIFGIIMQRLSCRKSVADNKTNQSSRGEMWRRVQNAVAISVLLGLTWLFGFLAIGSARLVFNILFLVLNSLQGFFVFLMFCVRQNKVREQWVRWMHCQCRRAQARSASQRRLRQGKVQENWVAGWSNVLGDFDAVKVFNWQVEKQSVPILHSDFQDINTFGLSTLLDQLTSEDNMRIKCALIVVLVVSLYELFKIPKLYY